MAEWTAARQANAQQIWATAKQFSALRVPTTPNWAQHAAYKAYIFVEPTKLAAGWSRDRIMAELNARGVPCYSGSCSEVYLEKAFDNTPWRPKTRLPVARELGETSLLFLVHPTLTAGEIEKTCSMLAAVISRAQAPI